MSVPFFVACGVETARKRRISRLDDNANRQRSQMVHLLAETPSGRAAVGLQYAGQLRRSRRVYRIWSSQVVDEARAYEVTNRRYTDQVLRSGT